MPSKIWAGLKKLDPRISVAAILFFYLVLGLTVLGFNRSPLQIVTTTLLCCSLDFVLTWIFFRRLVFPLSAIITSFSLSFLLSYSHGSWMIVLPPILAIGSKYVFRFNGKHFYNPALFGVAGSLLLSHDLITASPAYQWNGLAAMSIFVAMLGLTFVIPRVNRHWLVISFLLTFTFQTAMRAMIMRYHLPFETLFFGTLSSPSFFIFTFFMITDPATSPPDKKNQIRVGAAIAMTDLLYHIRQSYFTFFYAAMTVATIRFVWFHIKRLREEGFFRTLQERFIQSGYWKQPIVVGLLIFGSAQAYSKILYPKVLAPNLNFRFEKLDPASTGLNADKQGDLFARVDPRVQHVVKWLLAETEGIAIGDYDGDGLQDIFVAQPLKETDERAVLYHNLGNYHFEKIHIPAIEKVIKDPDKYGIITNAIFVDYDNSGAQSLFLTVVHGHSILLKNMLKTRGKAEFVDVSHEVGLDQFYTQSISATFADFNGDGLLDLYIANALEKDLPDYNPPELLNLFHLPKEQYPGDRRMFNFMHSSWNLADNGGENMMFFQTPDHKFVHQDPKIWGGDETRWSLAVGASDIRHNGWPDLYVANDFGPDELYYNQEGKGFESIKGKTFGSIGRDTYKGMDVSIADYDRNGWLGIYISDVHHALQAEGSLLWMFGPSLDPRHPDIQEVATQKGVLNEERFGWGAVAGDFDNSGWVDLAQANGMVDDTYDKKFDECPDYWYVNEKVARSPPSYHRYADKWGDIRGSCIFGKERNRLYWNRGTDARPQFIDIAENVGMLEETNSRAAVSADFSNNGRLDLIFTHPFARPTFYKNVPTAREQNSWVGLELEGNAKTCNRDAIGTRVELEVEGPSKFTIAGEVQAVSGLLGQSDRRLHFGLGKNPIHVVAHIHWCGRESQTAVLEPNRYTQIKQN